MFKIVAYDNFNRETVSEWVAADNIRSEIDGKTMVEALVAKVHDNGPWMYKLVPQDYKLYTWEP